MHQSHVWTSSLTEAEDRVVLHQRPGIVVHAVALVDQQLTHISRRHVCRDLHHFAGTILAPNLHNLKTHTDERKSSGGLVFRHQERREKGDVCGVSRVGFNELRLYGEYERKPHKRKTAVSKFTSMTRSTLKKGLVHMILSLEHERSF